MNEQELSDEQIRLYLFALKALATRGLLRWTAVNLGRDIYGSATPESGTSSVSYSESIICPALIVGAVCRDVRDSVVEISQRNFNRISGVPMSSFALPVWSGDVRDLWPNGWYLERMDRLEIRVCWNGKEKPGTLDFAYLMME